MSITQTPARYRGPAAVCLFVFACLYLLTGIATAAEENQAAKDESEPRKVQTQHRLRTPGGVLEYTATAADYDLKSDDGKSEARIFAISYTLNGVNGASKRPVTFVYNGGPGSSSIWLHMAFVGPRVIDVPSDAQGVGSPPYRLKDNPLSLLQVTDLVFMDPVGTGFSRAMGEKKDSDFWGVDEDAAAMNEFVRLYITREQRWNSPKYLLGESYGTIRAALMARDLQSDMEIALNGVILVSPAMNMGTLPFFVAGNDLPYATHLPPMAATAFYHQRLPRQPDDLESFLQEVREFAGTEYLAALFQGDRLDQASRERIAERLHQYTGVSKEYALRSDIRLYSERYRKELLRDQGLAVGRLDSRYISDEVDDVADSPEDDPSSTLVSSAFVALFQDYLAKELNVVEERRYQTLNINANRQWQRSASSRSVFAGFIDVTGALTQAATANPQLRIFVANGYHDLTTSFFASEYMMNHSAINASQYDLKNYFGGHMMYLHQPSFTALAEDLQGFIH